ncbi:unnamed protein product [Ectocarpus sp. CCAP 1310/34]|nr:unnamed protein product [Ectocarpus sp. CCAP 1310/34]
MLCWVMWISRDAFWTCAVGPRTPSRPAFDPRARYSRTTRPADTNLDASLESFPEDFLAAYSGKRPEWVVTSPPYSRALTFVKAAMSLATKGVAFKMPISFLEPCADRGGWLQTNPRLCVCFYAEQNTRVRTMRRRPADTNLDASLESFPEDFLAAYSGKRPEWVVTSPPYSRALTFVKAAMSLATKGVEFKMPISCLEPCADRGGWLQTNPPSVCLFLRRAKYTRANNAKMGEFWGVWYTQEVSCRNKTRLVFCPE